MTAGIFYAIIFLDRIYKIYRITRLQDYKIMICNSVSLCLCDKTHPRPREVVAVIISREVREVFILLSLLGDLEFWRFGVLESSFNTEAERHSEERELDA